MDRRGFIRNAFRKSSQKMVEIADARAKNRAQRWIRPPFCIDELEFLLTCTRCGECVSACPHEVLFALKAGLGAEVVATPAMDLVNRACMLCDGWPCVAKCEPEALKLPEADEADEANGAENGDVLPRLSRLAIDTGRCLPYLGPECGACEGSCPVTGALTWEMYKPVINIECCTGCAQCRHACVMDPSAINVEPLVV